MRTPDVNVLLYAEDAASVSHEVARKWLERSLSAAEPTGFTWLSLVGFLRIGTNPDIYPQPLSPREALDVMDGWLDHPHTVVLGPGDAHRRILRRLIESTGTAGNLTTDAHLAAIAIAHGATLASFDADFHRFKKLKLEYLG